MGKVWIIFALVLAIGVQSAYVVLAQDEPAQRPLRLGIQESRSGPLIAIFTAVYKEAFKRADIPAKIVTVPGNRLHFLQPTGEYDGDLARIRNYDTLVKGVVPIEEPMMSIKAVIVSLDKDLRISSFQDIENSNLRLVTLRGYAALSMMMTKTHDQKRMYKVNSTEQGLKMIQAGRADILLDVDQVVDPHLKSDAFKHAGFHINGVALETEVHGFMLSKHKDIATRISQVLKDMRAKGEIKAIQAKVLANLTQE